MIDDECGILCEAQHGRNVVTLSLGESEAKSGKLNRHLIDDWPGVFSSSSPERIWATHASMRSLPKLDRSGIRMAQMWHRTLDKRS